MVSFFIKRLVYQIKNTLIVKSAKFIHLKKFMNIKVEKQL